MDVTDKADYIVSGLDHYIFETVNIYNFESLKLELYTRIRI